MKPKTYLILLLAVLGLEQAEVLAKSEPRRLTRAVLLDCIRGGWAGQMIGVSYGAPTEFKSNARILEGELRWSPERVGNAIQQDDLYVEMTFAAVMDRLGLQATSAQYGDAFKDSQYLLWHANAGARRALNQGIKAPLSGHPKYNIHANDIDFQIEADFIGLMCPGMPRESNKYCERVGRVMNYGDGLYGGMFVCGMYAAAFFETDPFKVVQAGLACIPATSEYGLLIKDLLTWAAESPDDWRSVWQKLEDKWDKNDVCPDGFNSAFNIDAKINGAYIAFGLLFGKGDFLKTMEISTRCGQDSDCNPSSAAGVLGVMLGYTRIPDQLKSGIAKLANTRFDYTDYSFNDIVRSTENRAHKIVQSIGGKITDNEVIIPFQAPRAPRLETWSPGVPDRILGMNDPGWSWSGSWERKDNGVRISRSAGNEVSMEFQGVAICLVGGLDQTGGRADLYLDGKKRGVADAYIVERTYDNALWHTYGLAPGRHVLRLVTRSDADPRSKGTQIALEKAVVYRAP